MNFNLNNLYVICAFLILPGIYIVIPHIAKLILRKRTLAQLRTNQNTILSFDDGPDPIYTDRILEVLGKNGATAIFFVTGENASKYPKILENIISGGHLLGSHGYYHLNGWKIGPARTIQDWYKERKFFNEIEAKYNIEILYFRPPGGKFNIIQLLLLPFSSKKLMFWNIDPKDYAHQEHASIIRELQKIDLRGEIILLHDSRYSKKSNAEATVNTVKELLKKKGISYTINTLKN